MKHLIKELTWHHQDDWCSTKSPTHSYRIHPVSDKFKVIYCKMVGHYAREATGFTTLDQAKSWAFNHHCEKMAKWLNPDPLTDTVNWFKVAKPEPTDKDKTTQLACVFEEVAELAFAVGLGSSGEKLLAVSSELKTLSYEQAELFVKKINNIEALDATTDTKVTLVGFEYMMGYNGNGALKEVNASNWSKFENGKAVTDENGKIIKGEDYFKPELDKFVGGSENG